MEEITEEAAELVARVAGLDIGKASLVCCVRTPHQASLGRRRRQVRTFATTTEQLLELRDWLAAEGVTRCVMEATSVYWKAPFYQLEDAVAECWLVNAREARNVPGRPKTAAARPAKLRFSIQSLTQASPAGFGSVRCAAQGASAYVAVPHRMELNCNPWAVGTTSSMAGRGGPAATRRSPTFATGCDRAPAQPRV